MSPKKNILIVDDEKIVRELFVRILNKKAYKVQTAGSGKTALKKLKQEVFHLVILDLKMPGIGGLELLKQIKQMSLAPTVIIITGYGTSVSETEAAKGGAYKYITKPLDIEQVQLIIKGCLE